MNPTYQHYATHDESEYPHLWRGVVGSWAPCLGPSGTRLHDHSGRANWGTLVNMDPATDWVVDGGRYALDFDNTNDYVDLPFLTLDQAQPVSIRWWEKVTSTAGSFQSRFILKTTGTRGLIVFRSTVSSPAPYLALSVNGKNSGNYTRFAGAPTIADSVGIWREWTLVNTATIGATGDPWRLWVDGIEYAASAGASAGSFGNANCRIGLDGLGDDPANCTCDDVCIWQRSLHANEVEELHQIGRGGMYAPRRRRRAYSFGPSFLSAWARGSNIILQPCGVS